MSKKYFLIFMVDAMMSECPL